MEAENMCRDIWMRIQEILPPFIRAGTPLEHDWDALSDTDPTKVAVRAEMPSAYAAFIDQTSRNTVRLMLETLAASRDGV